MIGFSSSDSSDLKSCNTYVAHLRARCPVQAAGLWDKENQKGVINLLMSVDNRRIPWLFLVAVFRPLSMSFSFDASGKVHPPHPPRCLPDFCYLVFLCPPHPRCGLLSEPALATHPLIIHSNAPHLWLLVRWGWRDVTRDTGQVGGAR